MPYRRLDYTERNIQNEGTRALSKKVFHTNKS